jgi:hypothetical protein
VPGLSQRRGLPDGRIAAVPGRGGGYQPAVLAGDFVSHALEIGVPKVAMLLRLQFLESERRNTILDGGMLARVYPFANRLPIGGAASSHSGTGKS